VYVNSFCRGVVYGKPSNVFAKRVIPEVIELNLGLRREQRLSTSPLVGSSLDSPLGLRPEAKTSIATLMGWPLELRALRTTFRIGMFNKRWPSHITSRGIE
jgi:hypothetical protein